MSTEPITVTDLQAEPYAQVHLVPPGQAVGDLRAAGSALGLLVLDVQLDAVETREDLARTISRTLRFPEVVSSVDAVLDWLVDLDIWFEHEGGFLQVYHGLDRMRERAPIPARALVGIMRNVCNRWRNKSTQHYHVAFVSNASTRRWAAELIELEYAEFTEFAATHPWVPRMRHIHTRNYGPRYPAG